MCRASAELFCFGITHCCTVASRGYSSFEACVADQEALCDGSYMDAAMLNRTLVYDQAEFEANYARMAAATLSCTIPSESTPLPGPWPVFVGVQNVGGDCAPAGSESDPDFSPTASCRPGLYCSLFDFQCAALPTTEGADCFVNSGFCGAPGLYCPVWDMTVIPTCQRQKPNSSTCAQDPECESFFCDRASGAAMGACATAPFVSAPTANDIYCLPPEA